MRNDTHPDLVRTRRRWSCGIAAFALCLTFLSAHQDAKGLWFLTKPSPTPTPAPTATPTPTPSPTLLTTVVAAPNGSPTGDGSLARPYDFATAVSKSSPIAPGGQVLLRGGLYSGAFYPELRGTASQPIVVRSYPGEWAVFDAGTRQRPALSIWGSDTWYRDFEVTKSDPYRTSSQSGSAPTDISRGSADGTSGGAGIYVYGARTKLIDLVIHDTGTGIGFWNSAYDAEVYGCVIYNNGWIGPDRGHGHGIYIQNNWAHKKVTDSVLFDNYSYGVHAYANGDITGLLVDGVTSFNNGAPAGAAEPNIYAGPSSGSLNDIIVRNSTAYHDAKIGHNVRLGFPDDLTMRKNGAVEVTDNRIVGGSTGLVLQGWSSAVVRRNTFVLPATDPGASNFTKVFTDNSDPWYSWDDNAYVDPNVPDGSYTYSFYRSKKTLLGWQPQRLTFPTWVSSGVDHSSSIAHDVPVSSEISVRPNRYEQGRGLVTVLNDAPVASVPVDLSTIGLAIGQRYEIRDVQNLRGDPVLSGFYDGSPVTIPTLATVAMQPIGGAPYPVQHTPSRFGVFQVRPAP